MKQRFPYKDVGPLAFAAIYRCITSLYNICIVILLLLLSLLFIGAVQYRVDSGTLNFYNHVVEVCFRDF